VTETTSAIAAICTLLTVIAGFLFQYIRETRQHRWDRETLRDVKRDALEAAQALSVKSAERHAALSHQIADNTELTQATKDAALEAQREANHANEKLAAISVQANALGVQLTTNAIDAIDHLKGRT
jgi:cytochrome bd-type quinol oxidase subunit 1